ncbi:NADPH-dependent F420 reductase [Halobacteriales archaeon Cl-PHB]
MHIAILGGTGDIGEGLTVRFAADTDHDVVVGSRDPEKAADRADAYDQRLADHGVDGGVDHADNATAAADADVVVLAIPPHHVADTVADLADEGAITDQLLVSPAVGMQGDGDGLHYRPPSVGSVTELVAERAPADAPVAGAFHNLAADRLANLDATLDVDTLVVADDERVRDRVVDLASEIEGIRALSAGPLANAAEVESVTPLVINIARYNDDMHDVGVRFH